jgi:hypothetical protein
MHFTGKTLNFFVENPNPNIRYTGTRAHITKGRSEVSHKVVLHLLWIYILKYAHFLKLAELDLVSSDLPPKLDVVCEAVRNAARPYYDGSRQWRLFPRAKYEADVVAGGCCYYHGHGQTL